MVDNYQYSKSKYVQGLDKESPFVSKNWNFINDINGASYSNNGVTMVQFDLSSIYNSANLTDVSEMYFAIPITYVTAIVNGGAFVPPTSANGGFASTGLKSGYFNLVHACDVTCDGKPVETFQSFLNAYVSFKLLSQMSQDNLKTLGTSLGMGDTLDNPESLRFTGSANSSGTGSFPAFTAVGGVGGNGMSNNTPFPLAGNADGGDQPTENPQFTNTYNNGLWSRMKKVMDLSTNSSVATKLYGNSACDSTTVITNSTKFPGEFKPYYTVLATNYSVWYDVAIIRFCDLFDSFNNFPMMARFNGVIRLYINTGTVVSNIQSAGAGLMVTSSSGITFTNSCPLIQTALPTMPAGTALASGLFVGNPINTAVVAGTATVNFATAGANHFLTNCRIYYPQIQLKAELQRSYLSENRNKTVVYTSFYTNTINSVGSGITTSQLIQSGVSNIRGVLIIPLISGSTHGTSTGSIGVSPFSQLLSPFDTSPMTTAPISLLNLSVQVGGTNVLSNTLNFGYENFLEQVSLYEKINAGNLGFSCGLINQFYWENAYRVYYVDCTRGQISDTITPKNIIVSFTNNSLQTIDCLIFTEYFKSLEIDVETGKVDFSDV